MPKSFTASEYSKWFLSNQEKRLRHELENQRVLAGLEQFKTISVRQFIRKGLSTAVIRLVAARRVRLTGDDENKFVEVVS